jgi:autotransporter-associated beta strand protein
VTLANTAGAVLDLNGFNQTIGSLSGGGTTGGNVALGTGTLTLGDAASTTYAGVIGGAGSVIKQGSGALTLTGMNTYSGDTTINSGTIALDGGISGTVRINAAGTLTGNGNIAGSVINSGTIAPGTSFGAMTVNSYTHNAGAMFQVAVKNAGQSNKLIVTGNATLNGGSVSVLADSGVNNTNSRYTILTAGSVAGTFASVASNLAFLTPSLLYDATHVYLDLNRNTTSFSDVALPGNQYSVASALDRISSSASGDMESIISTLLGLSAPAARAAYDQMGGLSHTTMAGAAFFSSGQYMRAISGRMEGFFNGNSRSMFSGQPLRLALRTDNADDGGPVIPGMIGIKENSQGLWMTMYGGTGERYGNDVSSRYNYDLWGILGGFDRQVSGNLLLGISLGYSDTRTSMKDLAEDAKVNSYQGSVYGAYRNDPWHMSGILAYGYNRFDTIRHISFGDISRRATASYPGHTLGAYLEGGITLKMLCMDVIPGAYLSGVRLKRDSFTERDAGALNLDVDSDSAYSFQSALGLTLRKPVALVSGTVTPEIRAMWIHEFANSDYAVNSSFAGYPLSYFTVKNDRPFRDSFSPGAGISWQTGNIRSTISYDGNFSGDTREHRGTLIVRYTW